MKKHSQNGFAHLGLLLLLLVVVVIALVGFRVANNRSAVVPSSSAQPTAKAVQTIKTKADLGTAENTLNQASIDQDLNPDSLNSDVSSLL